MIFFTVGTHEDPFDRLIHAAEAVALSLNERVVVQRGYSCVPTPHCETSDLFTPDQIEAFMREASLVVMHAGPASILLATSTGHVPVVVPRRAVFGEHVDDHQVAFANRLRERVRVVDDPVQLPSLVGGFLTQARGPVEVDPSDASASFARGLGDVVDDVVTRRRRRPGLRGTVSALVRVAVPRR